MPAPAPLARETVAGRVLLESLAQQLGLARYEEATVRAVLAILRDADADLERQLRTSVDRRRQNTPASIRLRLIRQELLSVQAEAYRAVGQELEGRLKALALRTPASVARSIERVLPFRFSMVRPDPGFLAKVATENPFAGKLLSQHVSTLSDARMVELLRAVRIGLVQGETTDRITRRVMGTEAAGFADGALQLSRHQASAVTRTAVQHVHAEARDELYRENQDIVKGVMGVVTFDERTCRKCGRKDGKVWLFPDYTPDGHDEPWEEGAGRWHYQCRCGAAAVLGDVSEFERMGVDLSGLSPGQRAALDGPVEIDTEYPDWLRGASAEAQERALGKKRAAWWREHPDVSLEQAWATRFGGIPIEPAGLDEVFPPPGPLFVERFDASVASAREASARVAEAWSGWARGLEDDVREAVEGYQASLYDSVNPWLRGTSTPQELAAEVAGLRHEELFRDPARAVELLDRAFAAPGAVIGEDTYLYRGLLDAAAEDVMDLARPGARLTDPAFLSTSTSPYRPTLGMDQAGEAHVLFRIRAPSGTRGVGLDAVSGAHAEAEVVLPRGTTLEVLGAGFEEMKIGGKEVRVWVIETVVVPG